MHSISWAIACRGETVYRAHNIVRMCDEVWTFGEISDGVLAEVKLKKDAGQPVRYHKIASPLTKPASFAHPQF